MKQLIEKYANKLVEQGLCEAGEPLMGGLDAELMWNRESGRIPVMEKVINNLNINSILFAKPSEPYFTIINYLSESGTGQDGAIHPEDTETRTFLHDIPVVSDFDDRLILSRLKRRKGVIVKGYGIVTFGIVSPEQAFIVFSSICFSCFVKVLTDYFYDSKRFSNIPDSYKSPVLKACEYYENILKSSDKITLENRGPFNEENDIIKAMDEAGKLLIKSEMVDSFFGNISYRRNEDMFISQTGSSMDELEGFIDICPFDNSTSNAITASSEFSAHKGVYRLTDKTAILHGHPKFSAIMSMICGKTDCTNRGKCHTSCSGKRTIGNIPIVPGEVGTGPTGLYKTLPPAMKGQGVIVYGHGLFTVGETDFTDAFINLIQIENLCFNEYKKLVI